MLGVKRRRLVVEVVVCSGARRRGAGTSASSLGVKYAEPVGDEVQIFEEEGLGRLEDRWNPHPNRWECGKLQ